MLLRFARPVAVLLMLSVLLALLAFAFEGSLSTGRPAAKSEGPSGPEPPDEDRSSEQEQAPERDRRRLPSRRSIISWAIFLLLLVVAVASTPRILALALDTQHPIATVSGTSMWPNLKKGDLVALKGVDSIGDLQVGDIIAFKHGSGLAIHRIVKIEGETIVTKGDSNLNSDPPITFDQVVGKVPRVGGRLARVPLAGHVSMLMKPLAGLLTGPLGTATEEPETPVEEPEGVPIGVAGELSGGGEVLGVAKELPDREDATSKLEGTVLGEARELSETDGGSSEESQPPPVPREGERR
jgi:signal peptidase I